ncbi:MAG: hypothetical protein R6U98_28105 [Pirellulaceae bacterium]
MENCSTQAALPSVGLAANKVIHDRYVFRDRRTECVTAHDSPEKTFLTL